MLRFIVWGMIVLFASFPAIKLLTYYKKTKIVDYLLLSSAFFIAMTEVIVILILETGHKELIVYQINDILYPTFMLMFLMHGLRMRWDKIPIFVKMFIISWYLGMVISVLLYTMRDLPETSTLFMIKVKNTALISYGPAFVVNDVIIMGRGFELFAHLFRIFTIVMVLFAYLKTEDLAKLIQVKIARRFYLISIVFAGVFPLVLIGEMLFWWSIAESLEWHVFDLITFVGVAYITIRYPQTLLISKTQIIRTMEVIDKLDARVSGYLLNQHELEEYLVFIDKTVSELITKKN